MAKEAKDYFNRQGISYEERIRRNPVWRFIKNREQKAVFELLSPRKNEKIMDAGSGPGIYAALLKDAGCAVTCVDSSAAMINIAKSKGLISRVCEIESLRLGEKFDKIICLGVLEFAESPAQVLESLRKHLRAKGIVVLLVPSKSFFGSLYRRFHGLHRVNVRLFSKEEIHAMLIECGMELADLRKLFNYTLVVKARIKNNL